MTTLGAVFPVSEKDRKDHQTGLNDGYCIEIDADTTWSRVGLNLVGRTPVIGVGLSSKNIDELITLLKRAKGMMRK